MDNTFQIVLAWISKEIRTPRGCSPREEDVPKAAMWLRRGDRYDVDRAEEYASRHNSKVFVYPPEELEPLNRARRDIERMGQSPVPALARITRARGFRAFLRKLS